jgi:Type II restriction endonuclease EcoO109I
MKMNPLNLGDVENWVNQTFGAFHNVRLDSLRKLQLNQLLFKNPYLLRAQNITSVSSLITGFLDAFLSSSEEKLFGDFLEHLAVYVAGITCGGQKSTSIGVDLDFTNEGTRYIVSVKSGTNWGNSAQHRDLTQNLQDAAAIVKQGNPKANVTTVLGICYGNTHTSILNGYKKVVGQNFWCLISGNRDLYKEIIVPIGYGAKEHNDEFQNAKDALVNKMTIEFGLQYCDADGYIDWAKLVEHVSGNFDLDKPPTVIARHRRSKR